jgi:hypothetical protein
MKRFTKTYEEFIGDETVDKLKKYAEKETEEIEEDPNTAGAPGDGDTGSDNDGSGDEMGSDS